jgi:hypothetical protein
MSQRKELSFQALVTLDSLCQLSLVKHQECECLKYGYSCLYCRASSAKQELAELVYQIACDMNPLLPLEAV